MKNTLTALLISAVCAIIPLEAAAAEEECFAIIDELSLCSSDGWFFHASNDNDEGTSKNLEDLGYDESFLGIAMNLEYNMGDNLVGSQFFLLPKDNTVTFEGFLDQSTPVLPEDTAEWSFSNFETQVVSDSEPYTIINSFFREPKNTTSSDQRFQPTHIVEFVTLIETENDQINIRSLFFDQRSEMFRQPWPEDKDIDDFRLDVDKLAEIHNQLIQSLIVDSSADS